MAMHKKKGGGVGFHVNPKNRTAIVMKWDRLNVWWEKSCVTRDAQPNGRLLKSITPVMRWTLGGERASHVVA